MHRVEREGLSQKGKCGNVGIVKIGQTNEKDPGQVIDAALSMQSTNRVEEYSVQKDKVGFISEKIGQCKGFAMFPALCFFLF
jgi:hypothetical protein